MNRRLSFYLFFLSLFSIQGLAQDDSVKRKRIQIVPGLDEIIKLDFAPHKSVQIGNERVLTYELAPQKREITLKGKRPGESSVTIRDTLGNTREQFIVRVTETNQSKQVKELKDFLGHIEGIDIGIKSGRVYVGGHIVVPEDMGRIVTVLQQGQFENILFLVELSPQTQRLITQKMQDEIQKSDLRDVTVRLVNGTFWLEGIVSSQADKDRAEKIATAFYPAQLPSLAERTDSVRTVKRAPIQNFIFVNEKKKKKETPIPKLFRISTQFVELSKDYKKIFGLKWQPLLSDGQGSIAFGETRGGEVTTRSSNTLSGTIANLFPKLSSAKSAGHARIIRSGVILVKESEQGSIAKNETIPFALGTGEFAQAQQATAGFKVDVTPTFLAQEKISLKISVTISEASGTPPRTLENSLNTSLIVKAKESAVIGGIVLNSKVTDFDRNPPGGISQSEDDSASSLFSFIRSKNLTTSKSQFVVFVTPEILESASVGVEEIKRKFRGRSR